MVTLLCKENCQFEGLAFAIVKYSDILQMGRLKHSMLLQSLLLSSPAFFTFLSHFFKQKTVPPV